MLYPTKEEWANWGIEDPVHQFFALHWTELFDSATLDSWQVRTCNIRTILDEIVEAAKAVPRRESQRFVVRALLDEAFAVVRRDVAIDRLFPFVLAYLEPWRKKEVASSDVSEVEKLARVVLGNLEGYWLGIKKIVLEMLEDANVKKKYDLYDATMTLAVETVARGHSPGHVTRTFAEKVLCKSDRPFKERVSEMLDQMSVKMRGFACVFLASGVRHVHSGVLPQGMTLFVGPPEGALQGDEKEFYDKGNETSVYVSVDVEAVDPEAARHAAEQRLTQVFAALNLYGVKDKYGTNHPAALVVGPDAKQLVDQAESGLVYLNNASNRLGKARALLRVHDRLSEDDSAQLMAAVQYHRLALTSTSDEARFVNLWVALESMCQGGDESVVERVTSRVAPCVSKDNVPKTLLALTKYVYRLWENGDRGQLPSIFPSLNKGQLSVEDLLKVLLLEDGDQTLAKFTEFVYGHPLICIRLTKAHQRLLDGPKSIAENLRTSRQNVEWQLKRIYRVRNEIVHKGRVTPPIIRQLTQHLHSYFVKTIQAVVHELDRQPKWSIRDALEHQRRLFDYMVVFFSSTDAGKVSRSALVDPMNCLLRQEAPFAWKATLSPASRPSP